MKTIEWIMLAAFIGGLGLAVAKFYLFFPSKQLHDDDTTPEAVEKLTRIMVETNLNYPGLSEEELLEKMKEHSDFDADHFWRFNHNRLRLLIERYRFSDPGFRR